MGVPVTGDNTWRDGDTAAVDDVDTKVPLYIYTHYIHIQPDPAICPIHLLHTHLQT